MKEENEKNTYRSKLDLVCLGDMDITDHPTRKSKEETIVKVRIMVTSGEKYDL